MLLYQPCAIVFDIAFILFPVRQQRHVLRRWSSFVRHDTACKCVRLSERIIGAMVRISAAQKSFCDFFSIFCFCFGRNFRLKCLYMLCYVGDILRDSCTA